MYLQSQWGVADPANVIDNIKRTINRNKPKQSSSTNSPLIQKSANLKDSPWFKQEIRVGGKWNKVEPFSW